MTPFQIMRLAEQAADAKRNPDDWPLFEERKVWNRLAESPEAFKAFGNPARRTLWEHSHYITAEDAEAAVQRLALVLKVPA